MLAKKPRLTNHSKLDLSRHNGQDLDEFPFIFLEIYLSTFFVAYSGRNIEKVSAIMYFLSHELGADRFWFAPTKNLRTGSLRQSLSGAIEGANAVLSFESASTHRIMNIRPESRNRLALSVQLLLYEREEALRLNKKVINIAIGSPDKLGLDADNINTFNLSMSLRSKAGRTNLKELSSYLENM